MRIAVVADIHGNLPALEAVLSAVRGAAVDAVVCLGDLVGYGASPAECVALVQTEIARVVAGNHDWDVARGRPAYGTVPVARRAMRWTAAQLDSAALRYLARLPNRLELGPGAIAVHGCYLNDTHVNGYVTSTMLDANLGAVAARAPRGTVALCGHTHVPMCGWLAEGECHEHSLREPVQWPADAAAVLINPGAVGQPRDRDPRAAFALVDFGQRRVECVRVEYDVGAAADAIRASALPDALAERLEVGR